MARMTLTNENSFYEDIIELYKYFDYFYWQIDNNMENLASHQIKKFQKNYLRDIEKLFKEWCRNLKEGKFKILIPFLGIYFLLKTCERNTTFYYHCSPGLNSITINSKGLIYSCCEGVYRDYFEGRNIKTLIGNINSGYFSFKKHKIKEMCKNCDINYLCGGRCIWTSSKFYCECIRYLVNLIKTNINLLDKTIPKKIFNNKNMNVILSTEIIP